MRSEEEKCLAELKRGIKLKFSISNFSIFGCTVFMRMRDRDVSKLELKALEEKFMGYIERQNGYLCARTQHTQGGGCSRRGHQGFRSGLNL